MADRRRRTPGSAQRKARQLAGQNGGVVGRAQLIALDVTEDELEGLLERGELKRMWPGVYSIAGAPLSFRQRLLGACLWMMGHASHRSAAHLLDLPGGSGEIIEVSTCRSLKSSEVVVHRRPPLPQCDLTVVGGIPVTAPHRTVLDLGAVASETIVEMAIDEALRRGDITLPQLRWHLAMVGKRGCVAPRNCAAYSTPARSSRARANHRSRRLRRACSESPVSHGRFCSSPSPGGASSSGAVTLRTRS